MSTGARLPRGPRERQCEGVAPQHAHRHEDAMRRLLDGDAVTIGRALEIPSRTLASYQERHQAGRRGPGKLLSLLMDEALRCGRSETDAIAPLRALADERGYDLAPRLVAIEDDADVNDTAVSLMGEAADVLRTVHERASDGELSLADVEEIEREATEAIELLHRIIRESQARVIKPRREAPTGPVRRVEVSR